MGGLHARLRAATIAAAVLLSVGAASAPRLESIGPLTDKGAPEAVRASLEDRGERILLPEGPWCELWLFKSIPDGKTPSSGTLHPELELSTAVGVIRFLSAATDFRGQSIPPGLYTLRYAVLPNDGNHLGVSEYPDFLLAVPAADDPSPDRKLNFEQLVDSSRRATGTKHPAVLSLTQPSGTSFPSVSVDERGRVILQLKGKLRSGKEEPIALVVKGQTEQ